MSEPGWQNLREASPLEFQLLVSALGMSQAACGRYLDISPRTVKRYLTGLSPVPAPTVLLLRGLLAGGLEPIVPPRRRK